MGLFDLFKSKNPEAKNSSGQKRCYDKLDKTLKSQTSNYKLEKISNKQKRDWAKESEKMNQPKEVKIDDKQPKSYNYKKANEFLIYTEDGSADGDQIAKQMISSVKASLKEEVY